MRHQNNKLIQLSTWDKKKSIFMRQLLSNIINSGKVVTTPKRAAVLKSMTDWFFSKLLEITDRSETSEDAKRECIRYVKSVVYWEETWKKVINTLLPKYKEAGNKSFVADYKVWFRVWDASPKIMLKLI
jgi:ribosomal protein L17